MEAGIANLTLQQISKLLALLLPMASTKNIDRESQRLAITCLGNMCAKAGNSMKEHFKPVYGSLIANYEFFSSETFNNLNFCKV